MSSYPYTMEIYGGGNEYQAIPYLTAPDSSPACVKIGRGSSPTIWPVDISQLLSVAWEQLPSSTSPAYRWPAQREATFTLQAIAGASDVDKLRSIAAKSAQGVYPRTESSPLQITIYHGSDPYTAFGYIVGITPSVFEWKDGNVLLECRAVIISPWVKLVKKMEAGGTFDLNGDLPADVVFSIGSGGSTAGSFTITSSGGAPFSNTYGASGLLRGDTTRRWYTTGASSYYHRSGGAQGSGSYFLEKIALASSGNPYTLTTSGTFTYAYILDNYSQPKWGV